MNKKTVAYLLSEHSLLREDFRALFTTCEGRETRYFNLKMDYKSLRMETLNASICHRPAIKELAAKERAVKNPARWKLGARSQ